MTKAQDQHTNNHEKELKSTLDFSKSKTDHFAVWIIEVLGSIKFLLICIATFVVWIGWNLSFFPGLKPFDPFPFPVLEMLVSLFAIVLSVSVLINQNRQGKMEKVRQQVEFEVNVRAEHEITKILGIVHEMHQHMGLHSNADQELEEMKVPTDIKQIHQTVDDKESQNDFLSDL